MKILTSRAVLRVSGEDAQSFLQGLITQDVSRAGIQFSALLTPQGKILFDFFLVPVADGFHIDCAADASPALLKRLAMYKLRARVTLAEEPDLVVALVDGGAPDPRSDKLPSRAIVRRGDATAGDPAYDALRLSIGIPEFGKDFAGEEVFLLDVNYDALGAVSYAKGCFVGQEVTSRMKRKGEIRKRTVIARIDGAPPPKGAAIVAGEHAIGEIMSGAEGVALALVRLDRLKNALDEGRVLAANGRALHLIVPDYLERA